MGRDIHLFLEYQGDDRWETLTEYHLPRFRWLFDYLIQATFGQRPFPAIRIENFGLQTYIELLRGEGDMHHEGFLSESDIAVIRTLYLEQENVDLASDLQLAVFETVLAQIEALEFRGCKTRLVYWFDN